MTLLNPLYINPMEPNEYVIYDQFHWGNPDHLEVHVDGWDNALSQYLFYKEAFPTESLGLVDITRFRSIVNSIRSTKCNICQ